MGLDVYLYHCPNRKVAKAAEKKVELYGEKLWTEICGKEGEYDKLPKAEQEKKYKEYEKQKEKYAKTLDCTGEYESHKTVTKIEEPSKLHPDHMFKVGYFRSSYNSGGINSVLRNLGVGDLYYIFKDDKEEEYEFTPDWKKCLKRCEKVIKEYTSYLEGPVGNLSVMVVKHNPFIDQLHLPKNEQQAMEIVKKEIEKYQQSNGGVFDGNYSNRDGEFSLKEPLKVVAFIPGTNSVLGTQPCTYVVYKKTDEELETDIKVGQVASKLDRKEKDWYLQALEVTKETIEYVLRKPDPQNYYVHWSG